MANAIFLLIGEVATAVSSWFTSVFTASGMTGIFFAMISVVFCIRLLMHPIVGRGSDTANKKKSDGEDDA